MNRTLTAILSSFVIFLAALSLTACQQNQNAPVHNAVTDHVEKGVATMNQAESAVSQTNALTQQQVQQAGSADQP